MKRVASPSVESTPKRLCFWFKTPANDEDTHDDTLLRSCLPAKIRDGLPHVLEMIKILVMSPLEATVEAARTGNTQWLRELLRQSDCYSTPAAAVAAGENGQLGALELLYSVKNWNLGGESTTWKVLDAAATKGFLGVVKFACQHIHRGWYESENNTALSSAISCGHLEVVRTLLNPLKFRWDVKQAVEQAISEGQDAIVEMFYQIYSEAKSYQNETILSFLARSGSASAVTYLFEHGLWDAASIDKALVVAAERGHITVLIYLNGTGKVSSQAYDAALRAAARYGRVDVVTFLHTSKCASFEALNEAMVTTSNIDIAKYLFDTGSIAVESLQQLFRARPHRYYDSVAILKMLVTERVLPDNVINEAREGAAVSGDADIVNILYQAERFSNEQIVAAFSTAADKGFGEIVNILGDDACIPQNVLVEGFMKAASKGNLDVVRYLLDQNRVLSETITDAFILAAKRNRSAVVKELYPKQKAAPKVIGEIFERAARTGRFPIARTLLSSPHVTEEMKENALIKVTERGKSGARKFIDGSSNSNPWSQEALRKALEVARDDDIVSVLLHNIKS